jgi:serine/threonine protein phosphatase 1
MLKNLRKLLRPGASRPLSAIPAGHRVYAVGDIHGRADLFARLIKAIDVDDRRRNALLGPHGTPPETTVILLGDLIDRGPDSRGVVDLAARWGEQRNVRVLMGNHEEMFLKSLDNVEVLRQFLRFGGRETVLSFDVDHKVYAEATYEEVQAMMHKHIPPEMIDYIRGFENSIHIGDYLFVHAGIRPGTALDTQTVEDLRWIREPFLSHPHDLGAVIVHGHTITTDPVVRDNRLGIDTGAYQSGRLSAVMLEGEERWAIQAEGEDGAQDITVSIQPLERG